MVSEWSLVCNGEQKCKRWYETKPSDKYIGKEKINMLNYQELMINIFNRNTNHFTILEHFYTNALITFTYSIIVFIAYCIFSNSTIVKYLIIYLYVIYNSTILYKIHSYSNNIDACFEDEYIRPLIPSFIKVKKTNKTVFYFSDNTIDEFNENVLDETKTKIKLFNYITEKPELVKYDQENYVSWDIQGITNINSKMVDDFNYIKYIIVSHDNIDYAVSVIMNQFNYNDEETKWGLKMFIKSLQESLKNGNEIKIYYSEYNSNDECYIIKNKRIAELLDGIHEAQIFVECINSVSSHHINVDDIYIPYAPPKLDDFYEEYTVIINNTWITSNINKRNIKYQYKIDCKIGQH